MRPGPSSCWPSYGVSAGEGGPTFGVRKQWICGSKLRPIIGKPSLVVLQCWRFLGYWKHLIFHTFSVFYPFVYLLVVLDLFLHSFWNQRHWTCDSLRPSSSMAALMKPQWNKLGRMQSKKGRRGIRKSKEFRESRHPWLPSAKLKIA